MTRLEKQMIEILKDLRDNHHVIGVKAEFEAEGTRLEEALRLKEVSMKAELDLTIKIGGCEAIRDMYECRNIGVSRIIGPMIESVTALKKFLAAAKLAFPPDELEELSLAVNIETIDAINIFDRMLAVPEICDLDGIVMGRIDLTRSLGISTADINTPQVFNLTSDLFKKAKGKSLFCACGGGVSGHSLPFFRQLGDNMIDYYETRKLQFKCPEALADGSEKGILKAVGFELLWLKNKKDYYSLISREDDQRLVYLESKYKASIEAAGGSLD
jgi:4-hydroxy-2-oxoheptanedioate aldolase